MGDEMEVTVHRRDGRSAVVASLYREPFDSGAYTGVTTDGESIDARFNGVTWHEVTERDELIRALTSPRGARAPIITNPGIAADVVDVVADFLDSDAVSENRAADLLREEAADA